jgi:hypothetical protein
MQNKRSDKATSVAPSRYAESARASGKGPVTDEHKRLILDGLLAGYTLTRILEDNPSIPGIAAIRHARRIDPEFDQDMIDYRTDGLSTRIDEALEHHFEVRDDKHASTAAGKYVDSVLKSAEKLAPKSFGPMMRHAGANGEQLSVAVISFGTANIVGQQPAPQAIDITPTMISEGVNTSDAHAREDLPKHNSASPSQGDAH